MSIIDKDLQELKEICDKLSKLIDTFENNATQLIFLKINIRNLLKNKVVQEFIEYKPLN